MQAGDGSGKQGGKGSKGNSGNNGNKGSGNGGGMGGEGTGDGNVAPENDTDYLEKEVKFRSKLQAGEIIGQYSKRGNPPTGEAKKKVGEVIDRSRQEAQDAMNDQGFTPADRDLVKKYFDSLREHFNDTESGSENK